MAVHFFLHSVLYAIAICYAAEKIIEKLPEEIIKKLEEESRDDALQEISKYLADQPLVCLLAIAAGLYIAKEISEYLVEKFKGYAVEIIKKFVVAPVRENVVAPIRFQLNYLLCYKSNIEGFRTQMENLKKTRGEVQGLVDAAERKGQDILPKVQKWLKSVNQITEEPTNFFDDGLRLNLMLRYKRSRNAEAKTEVVEELMREAISFDRVSTPAVALESRKLIFEKVMEAVKDDGINMIGIYGMGGVGKTTLAKEVGKQAEDDNLFDKVVMSVVSQSPSVKRIQGEIAELLDLKLDAETELGRAGKLSKRLKGIKKILIILDDVWKGVKLGDIGIPFGEEHRGCKILLTSRSEKVCNDCNLMNSTTQKNFSIEVLSDEEGWKLFRTMAGDSVDSPDLLGLPSKVAKECAGLPLAIVTVARALQKKRVEVWRDALNKLLMTPDKEVFSRLELSYSYLEDEQAKSFFLLCCLFPEDSHIPIESLMMYGMGCRLFENVRTVDQARDRAYALADSLKSSCLLQEGRSKEFVKMHDVIRDVAISIASKSEQAFLVRAGAGWKEDLQEDAFKRSAVISLLSDDIDELPVELECPKLQILLLRSTRSSLQFPDNLSLRMENLKVLNIFSIKFLSLPQSFENLKNLRTLCLNDCRLKDISIVGELKKLEIISFRNSDIKELPEEIGMLTQLKMLDLTGCRRLTVIPSDVIPGLSRLEGLYMDGSFDEWEIEREDEERSNASIAELKHLSHLINLEIQIPHADRFPDDLFFKSLSRFKISVGTSFNSFWESYSYSYSKTLKLKLNVSTALKNGVKELLRKVEHFHLLGEMKGLKTVLYDLDRDGFRGLRYLIVEKCSEVEHIFNASECSELQELRLRYLPRLINLWKDPTRHVGFRNLTVVKVEACDGLKNLFSHSVAKQLSKALVELEVKNCKIMEEIVGNGKEAASVEVDDIVFLHLRSLRLRSLPNLRNFCSNVKGDLDTHTQEPLFDKKVAFPVLETLQIENIGNLIEIGLRQLSVESFSQLKVLKLEGLVVEEGHVSETPFQLRGLPKLKHIMRWDMCPHGTLGFQNLSSIHIYKCNSRTSLLSPSMASNLVQLQELEIDSCEMMESIIAVEREGEDCIEIVEFPQLRTLRLKNLPKLISFMQTFTSNFSIRTTQEGNLGDPIQPLFDKKLRLLKLKNLPKLISFMKTIQQKLMIKDGIVKEAPQEGNLPDPIQPLFDEKVTLLTIEVLEIEGLDKLEDIWHPQFQAESFCQLKLLKVESCHKISNVIPSNLLKHLTNLKEVSVKKCDSVEIIFEVERLDVEDRRGTMTLSQLRKLSLSGLPKLFTSKHPILQKLQMDDEESKGKPDESSSCIPIRPLFDEWVAFTNLVELKICYIGNLQKIFHTRLANESFSQLRILEVTQCHKLSRVAPSNLLPRLKNLEKLIVEGCNSMEKIFELEGEGGTPISLSQLKYVELHHLPNLMMFCSGKYDFELPSLVKFRFIKCPKMQTFSSGLKGTPKLKTVEDIFRDVWKGDLNSTIYHLFQEKEIKERLYVIEYLVYGLRLCEQESNVQEDEDKDQDEEVGEKSEVANTKDQEREENISARAIHHEIQEAAEEEGPQKGSLEEDEDKDEEEEEELGEKSKEANIEEQEREENISAQVLHHVIPEEAEEEGHQKVLLEAIRLHLRAIRLHLQVTTNLLDGLVFRETELGVVICKHLERVTDTILFEDGLCKQKRVVVTGILFMDDLYKWERVVVTRKHLKRMMDLVDRLGWQVWELRIEEEEDDEEEEGESEKAREANIEELQEIREHLKEVIWLVEYCGGLRKRKCVVEIRRQLKRMMDLVDILGLREQELSIVSALASI